MDETAQLLNNALRDGTNILFEGAQGTLLDIDHGTYPYVTSSSCCTGGAATGTGVGPRRPSIACWAFRRRTLLRVGGGPFPTELSVRRGRRPGQDAVDGENVVQRRS